MYKDDYYKILQVHCLAEPEVIEGAYKRLAKKYHPDVNGNIKSIEMMQRLNQAYEVLSDSKKRRQYDLSLKEENNQSCRNSEYKKCLKSFTGAKLVLDEYFENIRQNHFDFAYELISKADRLNISRDDFISWQSSVSKVFQLKEYSCNLIGLYKDKSLEGRVFSDIVEFMVDTVEYNAVTDMVEKDRITKVIIPEENKWRVLVGYEDLQPIIDKFQSLTGLLTAKSIMDELAETHSRVDTLTGLLNRKGIIEIIRNEILRFDRYGNVFSLIMCEIDPAKATKAIIKDDFEEHAVKLVGETLIKSLRKLDAVGRWGRKAFLILLPETGEASAVRVTHKLHRILKLKALTFGGKDYIIPVKLRAVEYMSSLEESLDRIAAI